MVDKRKNELGYHILNNNWDIEYNAALNSKNHNIHVDQSMLIVKYLQKMHFFTYNSANLQLSPPIIEEKKEAFEKLISAIGNRCHIEIQLSKLNTLYPYHHKQHEAAINAEQNAYNLWVKDLAHIPDDFQSSLPYQSLCKAIEERQKFAYDKHKREVALTRINLYTRLAAELYVDNNNDSSIITIFQEEWQSKLAEVKNNKQENLIKMYSSLLESLQSATKANITQHLWQERLKEAYRNKQANFIKRFHHLIVSHVLENLQNAKNTTPKEWRKRLNIEYKEKIAKLNNAIKGGERNFIEHFTELLKELQKVASTDQNRLDEILIEAMSNDKNLQHDILLNKIAQAVETQQIARIKLVKFLRTLIKDYLHTIAVIDETLGAIAVDQALKAKKPKPHINTYIKLNEIESFTDCIFVNISTNLNSTDPYTLFSDVKESLLYDYPKKEQIGLILKQLTLKRDMIYASIDWEDKESINSRSEYINIVAALAYLYHFLPEYTNQLEQKFNARHYKVDYKNANADIELYKKIVIQYIDRHINYFTATQQQQQNTQLFNEIDDNILTKEINRLGANIHYEVKTTLMAQEASKAGAKRKAQLQAELSKLEVQLNNLQEASYRTFIG